jgi:ABC-type transporter Mla subunit MlaD
MRRPAAVLGLFLLLCVAACSLRRQVSLPSPYCRGGNPVAGVYHPQRLRVKSHCRVAVGTVAKVKFEEYDGDVHVDLRLDPGYEKLLSDGNSRIGGDLVVEIVPQDRSRVAVPQEGARIEVVGPWVDDTQHGWNEIHPAWWVSAGTIQPATVDELRRAQALLQGGSDNR